MTKLSSVNFNQFYIYTTWQNIEANSQQVGFSKKKKSKPGVYQLCAMGKISVQFSQIK